MYTALSQQPGLLLLLLLLLCMVVVAGACARQSAGINSL
jgi:hypothetical protein